MFCVKNVSYLLILLFKNLNKYMHILTIKKACKNLKKFNKSQ